MTILELLCLRCLRYPTLAVIALLCLSSPSLAQEQGAPATPSPTPEAQEKQPEEASAPGEDKQAEPPAADSQSAEKEAPKETQGSPIPLLPRTSSAPKEEESKLGNADDDLLALGQVELLRRADEVERQLAGFRQVLKVPKSVEKLQGKLTQEESKLIEGLDDAKQRVKRASRWFVVSDIRFVYSDRLQQLKRQREPYDRFVEKVGDIPRRLEELQREWEQVRSGLREVAAPQSTQARVAEVIHSIRVTRLQANSSEALMARVGSSFERMEASINELVQLTREGAPTLITHFSYRSPVAQTEAHTWEETKRRLVSAVSRNVEWARYFVSTYHIRVGIHGLIFLVLLWGMNRAKKFHLPLNEGQLEHEALLLRRPYAAACVLTAFASLAIYPTIPAFCGLLIFTFAVASALFLLLDDKSKSRWKMLVGIWVILGFLTLHLLFSELPRLENISLPGEAIAVILMCILQIRHSPRNFALFSNRFGRLVSQFWIVCCLVGLLAWGLSYVRSASILIDGSARMLLLTIAYRVAYDICCALIHLASTSPWATQLFVFRTHGELVSSRVQLLVRWALVIAWIRGMLSTYTLLGTVKGKVNDLLNYTIHAGALDFSLQSTVIVLVGIFLAVTAAKFTRFALTEEVMPRTALRLGSQAALTSSAYYFALGIGLFMTLAAAGIQLDRIAILVSALGVGIGFGLQNIVSNFISGVILMIERPVNVGDKIQLEDMFGIVEKIGFRASRVRTFDGAEVIVPNSELVADRVINWSLSDDRRRIEVNVGVKYGTDPEQVQEILLRVAQAHPDVLKVPAPDALFVEFGDSSLNFKLRGHTDNGSNWVAIHSDLNVAVNRELTAANIEIPFPQRDLHLRSIDEEVSKAFSSKNARSAKEKKSQSTKPTADPASSLKAETKDEAKAEAQDSTPLPPPSE